MDWSVFRISAVIASGIPVLALPHARGCNWHCVFHTGDRAVPLKWEAVVLEHTFFRPRVILQILASRGPDCRLFSFDLAAEVQEGGRIWGCTRCGLRGCIPDFSGTNRRMVRLSYVFDASRSLLIGTVLCSWCVGLGKCAHGDRARGVVYRHGAAGKKVWIRPYLPRGKYGYLPHRG